MDMIDTTSLDKSIIIHGYSFTYYLPLKYKGDSHDVNFSFQGNLCLDFESILFLPAEVFNSLKGYLATGNRYGLPR